MENIKLSDKDRQILNKYNLYLMAVVGIIVFDFENQTVTLRHTRNVETSETEEIGEFKLV
jgi:hypothetical protein